jgi:hypothetical protein
VTGLSVWILQEEGGHQKVAVRWESDSGARVLNKITNAIRKKLSLAVVEETARRYTHGCLIRIREHKQDFRKRPLAMV